ncbi:MAG: PAS domain S-box protein [Anaerolineales bacterium]|nr:PAS domain S-box protein [Anaerolineales bacterium]
MNDKVEEQWGNSLPKFYQALFEQAADGIFIADMQGRYIEVNQRGCELLGYTREEVLNLSMQDLVPAEDQAHEPLHWDDLLAGKIILSERRLRRKDGRLLLVEISGRMLSGGFFLGMVRDISERKQIEQKLSHLAAIVTSSDDAIIGKTLDGIITSWNSGAERMYGYTESDMIGKPISILVPPGQEDEVPQILDKIRTGQSIRHYETTRRCKDGQFIDVFLSISPILAPDGNIIATSTIARDITARKQMEKALKEQYSTLHSILESTEALIFSVDQQYRYTSFNQAHADVMEAIYGAKIQPGFSLLDYMTVAEDREEAKRNLDRALAGERHVESAHSGEEKRSRLYFEVSHNPILTEDGTVIGVSVFSQDITARKRAEVELREAHQLLETIFDHTHMMVACLDPQLNFVKVNRAYAEADQRDPDFFPGKNHFDLYPNAENEAIFRQVVATGEPYFVFAKPFEYEAHLERGVSYWDWSLVPIKNSDGEVTELVLTLLNVTDRLWAEQALRESEVKFRNQAREVQFIVDTVPEGIFLLGNDHLIRLTNPNAEEYLALLSPGWQDGRLTRLGQRPLDELLTSPPKGLWHEVMGDGRCFDVIARPIEDSPQHQGWVFVLRDVTKEREIRQQVQRQERLAVVGQLAAGIAHDFNNTLAVIQLYTDLLLQSVNLPVYVRKRLRVVDQQTQRATDLIQQILDFSRQSLMEKRPLDLPPFLEEMAQLLKRTLPENIQLKLNTTHEECIIQADPSRIQQVILNLAFNARDAMPQGGQLIISLKTFQLDIGAGAPMSGMSPGNWILLTVTDSGTGMPPETRAHIFEPFFTTKEKGKGSGLGLAQVYGIVQRHGAFIDITTQINQGTTFYLYFPSHSIGNFNVPTLQNSNMPLGQGQLVLVVEDEETMRRAFAESLNLLNYKVLEAGNGREALALLADHSNEIALVLSDAIMPEMGGIALFHTLRELHLSIPFVMVTGYAVEKDIENLRALGLSGWLTKPADLVDLAQLLHQILT